MAISTDYRDSRKSAYQQYAVVADFNGCRLPKHISTTDAAALGVAFVAAALGLGICMGLKFVSPNAEPRGPDLISIIRGLPRNSLSKDIRPECLEGIEESERPVKGDWIAIWGGEMCCHLLLAAIC